MVETTEPVEEIRARRAEESTPTGVPRHWRLAQVLAVFAFLAALAGAVGPAEHVRTTYSWPPEELPTGTPSHVWYTPLLLTRRIPDSVSVRIPCSLPRALPAAQRPLTVLATARYPERNRGLAVTRSDGRLLVAVGGEILGRLDLAPAGDPNCAYALRIFDRSWSVEGGPAELALAGTLQATPVVNGLFSALDLRSGTPPSIDVATAVHAARPIVRQKVAWILAALLGLSALLLVSFERRPRRLGAALTAASGRARPHARAVDAAVAALLLGWWLIGPAFIDDGWIAARTGTFSSSGGFSAYYNALGANHPLGYWLEWLQHWLTETTDALLLLRVPALVCLAATWVLCRWILARLVTSGGNEGVVLWALASAFAVGALSWGMTLRPEPYIAILATGVFACTVRFLERETVAPLALAGMLAGLAFLAHPAGIVSLAPLLAAAPRLIRWAWPRLALASTIVFAAAAVVMLLAFVGSDLELRRADADTHRTFGDASAGWREEVSRYANLFGLPSFGSPMRHLSVALILLAVVAFLIRRRRTGRPLLDLPSTTLIVSLLLLFTTPSKWPWHFGTFLGVTALAVASETARLRSEAADRSDRRQAWPFLAIGAAVFVAAWTWSPRGPWNALDLQSLDWILGFERNLSLATLAALVPLVLLGAAGFLEVSRGRPPLRDGPWRVASLTAPALALPVIVFTVGVFVVDAAKTGTWTLARQNLGTLAGDPGCGYADDALVPGVSSMRPLSVVGRDSSASVPAWVPPSPVEGLPRFALGPIGQESTASPWFDISDGQPFGVFVGGAPELADDLALEWGRRRGSRIETLGSDALSEILPAPELRSDLVTWRFLSAPELPTPAENASAARLVLRGNAAPGSALGVTAPVTFASEPLVRRLGSPGSLSLALPNMLMYVPCVSQPRLAEGVVEVPDHMLAYLKSWPVGLGTSPFSGVLDLYTLQRFPIEDASGPSWAAVYDVDRRIPGAAIVAPEKATG